MVQFVVTGLKVVLVMARVSVFFPTGLNLSFSRRLFLLCGGKNMLDVCCDLTPYETSRWLELKPDRENVTRSGTVSITYGTNATPE